MNNEEKILSMLETLVDEQQKTNQRLDKLEQRQTKLEQGQAKLEQGQAKLEQGQFKLERQLPAMEKRIVGEINLQVSYVLEDIEKTEKRILSSIKPEALIK